MTPQNEVVFGHKTNRWEAHTPVLEHAPRGVGTGASHGVP